jgi:ribosomal protein S18 acetylase RimI-like enzyme
VICDDDVVSVEVRRARPDELDEVGALTVEAYAADGAVTREDPYAELLADAASRAHEAVLLVASEPAGALLGTVTFVRPGSPFSEVSAPDEAEIRMLAVAPAARGRGLGETLTRATLDLARAEGYAALVLSSATWMRAAHRLYERMGFVRTPERDWQPRPDVDLVTYRLTLVD